MQKNCSRCGNDTQIELRNVMYRNRVKILNVPVQVCTADHCAHVQVVDMIKDDLKRLMEDLGQNPQKQSIEFEDVSELSNALMQAIYEGETAAVQEALMERVDGLLDLFLLAQSLGDETWMSELRQRFTKILI